MSTTIGYDSKFESVIMPIFMGLLLGAAMLFIAMSNTKQQEQAVTAPCTTFASLPLNQIPARCITPQGGFKP